MKYVIRVLFAGSLVLGCSAGSSGIDAVVIPDGGEEAWEPAVPEYWEVGPQWFDAIGAFYEAHGAAFQRMSLWFTHVSGPVAERPDIGHRGSFGTGNGRVFGFVGLADPLNTLHSLIGPTYERRDRFFGDYTLYLLENGKELEFDEEWAGRSLTSPVMVTRGRRGGLEMDTVDFAPWTEDVAAGNCFIRILLVRNKATDAVNGIQVQVRSRNPVDFSLEGTLVEPVLQRRLVTRFAGAGAVAGERSLTLTLDPLAAGEERELALFHCAQVGNMVGPAPSLDPDALLDETVQRFSDWGNGLVQADVPDPLVRDFIDNAKITMKVQQAETGATCPMSEYTRTWMRDNTGPVRAFLTLGGHEDVLGMLDYVYGAATRGNYSNSYDADLDLTDLPPAPDWDAMPPLSGKVAAETPSYFVIMHGWYYRHTGDLHWADDDGRWALLKRGLMAQGFGTDHLLPWTGDETFRAAMNSVFGLFMEYPHHEVSWSANSSLLWLAAQKEYARLAASLGHDEDAAASENLHKDVEAGFLGHYILDDGCVSALVERETMETWPAPYEDSALKLTWAGWKDGDDPLAQTATACLVDRIGIAPGILQSPLHPDCQDLEILPEGKGMYTGMKPGYTLSALADTGHSEALDAFNAVQLSVSTSGNLTEYRVEYDHSGLSLTYDPVGELGDYTAKFRPWETGIVVDAVMQYLLGWRPDAPEKALSLRPHLPNGWPRMAFSNLRARDARFDVEVRRVHEREWEVTVTSHAGDDWTVDLRWDAPGPSELWVGGAVLPAGEIQQFEHFGQASTLSSPQTLSAGKVLVFRVVHPD